MPDRAGGATPIGSDSGDRSSGGRDIPVIGVGLGVQPVSRSRFGVVDACCDTDETIRQRFAAALGDLVQDANPARETGSARLNARWNRFDRGPHFQAIRPGTP
jgi:hypothetical protein